MSDSIRNFLREEATHARSNYDRGKLFEEVVKIYFENDKTQQLEYDKVWGFSDWASKFRTGQNTQDIGIDLVAELRKKPGKFCAIQCKFYAETTTIQKKHIDSFVAASAGSEFARRILFDTTAGDLGKNAQSILNHTPNLFRFSFQELDQSSVNWSVYFDKSRVEYHTPKQLRPHQEHALKATIKGFQKADRGQVIMACGTGKTLTALRIAETQVGIGRSVLVLVPSLALMHQTIVEWGKDAKVPLKAYAVCSDKQAGRRKFRAGKFDSLHDLMVSELVIPATTDAQVLSESCINHHSSDALTVVYGTYQSLNVVKDAQQNYNLPKFDLTICDEAHRTTGKFEGKKESSFVLIHSNDNIQSVKRLYMTATPRIYAEQVKSKAKQLTVPLCSMDDAELYGMKFFRYGFVEAVEDGILSDYKVVVLAVDAAHVARRVERLLGEDNELLLDLTGRLLGCWRALTKVDFADEVVDKQSMRTALAFSNSIRTSKAVAENLADTIANYRIEEQAELPTLECEAKHIDGTFNAKRRSVLLNWLKEGTPQNHCRILTNARCLTEGVDVPSLDAILFLEPRKSQLDVVQAVGRVMRKAEGKERGYVVLPVLIPAGVDEYTFLNQNERFKVIWQILNALRSHDERMDATIHKSAIGEDISSHIVIKTLGFESNGNGGRSIPTEDIVDPPRNELVLDSEYIVKELKAQLVKRCGRVDYWEDWAGDVGDIARAHITRIREVVNNPQNVQEREAFQNLLGELQDDLNPSVSEEDAIEVLAQHLVTGPVFNVLFQGHQFTKENTVSQALQSVAETLKVHRLSKETKSLDKFYESVQRRVSNVSSAAGRQHLITELYETFFRKAFPRTTTRLGIVYTPIEIVDFILHSVNDVLEDEFGRSISDEGVHVLDPFVGTGTFLTRLLNSKLIRSEDLERKYRHEIHANEIVLLAYYIAGINIEAVYHERLRKSQYEAFTNLCLTDTFQMQESENELNDIFPSNSIRVENQKKLDIQVIVGNPPWSAGQRYANEDNPNLSYQALDQKITETYVSHSSATLRNSLYDSYIRAIRWSSDRIGERGVIGFVTNGGWLEGKAADGLRHCLQEEFSSLYVFNLRGNTRFSGERVRKEGGKVFGPGSRATVVISILVKNPPPPATAGQIYYRDIGNYLTREDKLKLISKLKSTRGIEDSKKGWQRIEPNRYHEWIHQRDLDFDRYIQLGNKKEKRSPRIFFSYSRGLATSRDAWCYNASRLELSRNVQCSIEFFNREVLRYQQEGRNQVVTKFINMDPTKFKWDRENKLAIKKNRTLSYFYQAIREVHYRPFTKTHGYFHRTYNNCVYQLPQLFPRNESLNRAICVHGLGANKEFSTLMVDILPDLSIVPASQCFPLYLYETDNSDDSSNLNLNDNLNDESKISRQSAITPAALEYFQVAYSDCAVTEEEIFYFIYGLLHSEEYRKRFQNNFVKQLPRIPLLSKSRDFLAFCDAGRKLAELHVNYEQADLYPLDIQAVREDKEKDFLYNVDKPWKFFGKRPKFDRTKVRYNHSIILSEIPLEAYDYVVNGKPALEWVMERQCIKQDGKSGIVTDANKFALEARNNPKYPLELFQRVVTVSLETMKIVGSLPNLDIRKNQQSSHIGGLFT